MVTNPETVLNQYHDAGRPPSFALQTNYAEIAVGFSSLRLSTPGWANFPLSGLRGIDTTELLFELSKEKIVTRIQPFAKRVRLFVERYFDFMTNHIAANFDQLPSDPLIKPLDWIFSAWLPLPHAKILVSPDDREKPAQIVEFDLIFWTGVDLIGIQVEQKGTLVKSKREAFERFTEEHPQFKLISVTRDQLPDDKPEFPDKIFDENFLNFWSGTDLPKGPPLQQILNSKLLT
jgi:hypothetical protein